MCGAGGRRDRQRRLTGVDLTVLRTLNDGDRRAIQVLLDRAAAADGHYGLNDEAWLDYVDGNRPGFAAILVNETGHDHLVAYGQVTKTGESSWSLHTVIDPHHRFGAVDEANALVTAGLHAVEEDGGGDVQYWVSHPTALNDAMSAEHGLHRGRDLLQMRVDLPLAERTDLVTRPFEPGRDEEAWVRVNNRAFAWHPEQGGWTVDALRRRELEDWFSPEGFLLHEIDGELAGFCWTKVHKDPVPMGEIYVIAVDPDHGGKGLGRQLTAAGLQSLAQRGERTGMLFVDADNTTAVRLYEKLGFHVNHVTRAYRTAAKTE